MGKPDGQARCSVEENSGMAGKFLEVEYLLNLVEDEKYNAYNQDEIELDGIDVANCDKRKELWLVPEEHRVEVLRQHHDSQVAGHWRRHKTQELVSHNFTWDIWSEHVTNFVAWCIKWQKSKADRHSRPTKLVPIRTGEWPCEEIAIDFVGALSESAGFTAILVITDRFNKILHFLPAKRTWTAADIANGYINEIWRVHRLTWHISFDYCPWFANKFYKDLNRYLNIKLHLFSSFHRQTDGHSERGVETLKQDLRIYYDIAQTRWRAWPPLREFGCNPTSPTTQGYSLYPSLYGFNPRIIHDDHEYELSSRAAEEWLDRIPTMPNQIHDALKHIK